MNRDLAPVLMLVVQIPVVLAFDMPKRYTACQRQPQPVPGLRSWPGTLTFVLELRPQLAKWQVKLHL